VIPAQPPLKPGKVRASATWKYNNFVGNKPDTDAVVLLIPKGFQGRVPETTFISPVTAHLGFESEKKKLQQQGIYAGLVGGNGSVVISRVPAGDYVLVIMSRHTNDWPNLREYTCEKLARYLEDGVLIGKTNKAHFEDITADSGEETECSHDFGMTYSEVLSASS
jgi:hypothetical protein